MKFYSWNLGKWHYLIGYDPAHRDFSRNAHVACGTRKLFGVPEVIEVSKGEFPDGMCQKCRKSIEESK